jgi:hypothetical protein
MKIVTFCSKNHSQYTNTLPEGILWSFLMVKQMMYTITILSYSTSFKVLQTVTAI